MLLVTFEILAEGDKSYGLSLHGLASSLLVLNLSHGGMEVAVPCLIMASLVNGGRLWRRLAPVWFLLLQYLCILLSPVLVPLFPRLNMFPFVLFWMPCPLG